jgi:type I restriction enzyme S subunit
MWYGTLPDRWTEDQIRRLFTERKEKVSDKDFAPLSVSRGGVVPQMANVAKSNDGDHRKLVRTGDFAINSRSDRKGSSGISKYDGSVSLINIVLTPRLAVNGNYIHYLLKSHNFIEEYYRNGRGIVADLWTTRYSEMKTISIPLPPRDEQDQIVRFLDWKVSRINKLINNLKKQIELLNEQKQAIINKAVTQGLNDNVPMKDSGIPWIGMVPKEWHIRPFSKIARVCSNLVHPQDNLNLPQVSSANIEKNTGKLLPCVTVHESGIISDNHRFYQGQILYSKIRPKLNKVTIAPFDGLCSADMYPIETKIVTKYLMFFMLSHTFFSQLSATENRVKMPKINQEELSKIIVTFPHEIEQNKIVSFVEYELAKIDKILNNISGEISLLTDYRTRLIGDVVTGKIDVRCVAVPEYEDIEDIAAAAEDDISNEESVNFIYT